MLTTPTLWRTLLDSGWAGQPELKMISRGETLSRDLADELLQRGSELWKAIPHRPPTSVDATTSCRCNFPTRATNTADRQSHDC